MKKNIHRKPNKNNRRRISKKGNTIFLQGIKRYKEQLSEIQAFIYKTKMEIWLEVDEEKLKRCKPGTRRNAQRKNRI